MTTSDYRKCFRSERTRIAVLAFGLSIYSVVFLDVITVDRGDLFAFFMLFYFIDRLIDSFIHLFNYFIVKGPTTFLSRDEFYSDTHTHTHKPRFIPVNSGHSVLNRFRSCTTATDR